MLLRGVPYSNPDQLGLLVGNVQRAELERRGGSYPDFLDWREQSTAFEDIAAYSGSATTIASGEGDPERITIEAVSAPYFSLLDLTPEVGRTFREDEDEVVGRDAVAILGYDLWQRRFGGDQGVVGQSVRLGTQPYEVIGVMPAGFTGLSDQADLWIPFVMSGFPLESRGSRWLVALGRLAPDASLTQAQNELNTISSRLEAEYPDSNEARGVEVSPLSVETFGDLRPAVLALMAAVGLVLLIACANVANLLIGRSELRQKEIAVRTALGAGRMRLLRQLVTESCVLAGLGAGAGLLVAYFAVGAMMASAPVNVPSFVEPSLNLPVLLFTVGTSLVCGLLLGVAPALHARATRLGEVLKESARGSTGRRSQQVRSTLVVAEVSLAVVLLVGAGLMIRTVTNLTAVDPGFETESLLTLNVSIPRDTVAPSTDPAVGPPPLVTSPRDMLDQLEAVPGVLQASLVSDLPLNGGGSAIFYAAEGDDTAAAEIRPRAYVHRVTPGFFETMGMPILAGRTYLDSELRGDSTSIIVSEGVAKRFWPGEDPIGKRIKQGALESPTPWLSIVGVVPDTKYRGLPDNPTGDPDLFFPYVETGVQGVVLRTGPDPASLESTVRSAIRRTNPQVVVYNVSPIEDLVGSQTSQSRFTTWLMGLFAMTALLLSVVGLYGVMSYLVAQRTREFGIRVALGAGRGEIVGVVVRHGVRMIAVGVVIGSAAAFGLARWLESLLFNVSTTDASSVAAIGVLAVVALAACVVPAIRATRVDPVQALRGE
jgi:putative ABC transport system permease protein